MLCRSINQPNAKIWYKQGTVLGDRSALLHMWTVSYLTIFVEPDYNTCFYVVALAWNCAWSPFLSQVFLIFQIFSSQWCLTNVPWETLSDCRWWQDWVQLVAHFLTVELHIFLRTLSCWWLVNFRRCPAPPKRCPVNWLAIGDIDMADMKS